MKKNDIESEINRIRVELYEETKHMTAAEHTRWSNDRAQRLADRYGFKIGKPPGRLKSPTDDVATPEDIAAYNTAMGEYRRGECVKLDDVDWT